MNDLIHGAGMMTVHRNKWVFNSVSNKSITKINRREEGLGKKGGGPAGVKGTCHGDLHSPSAGSVCPAPPGPG